jgi:hypothetical protein
MVYGRAIHFQEETQLPTVSARGYDFTRFSGTDWLERRCRAGHNVIASPEVVVRGSIQRAVGGYRPELPHAGDLEMWLRIAAVSGIAYVKAIPQAFYRVHSSSMLRTRFCGNLIDLTQRKAAFDTFFQHHRHRIADSGHMHDLANRALAREALWDACRAYDHNRVEESRAGELVEFAMNTYAAAASLSEYAAFRRRRRLGPAICNRTQLFAATALIRRVHRWVGRQRWQRRGV